MKKILFLFLATFLLSPIVVKADKIAGNDYYPTTDERKQEYDEILDKIPNTSLEEDGWHIILPYDLNNIIEPNLLSEDTLADYCKADFCYFYEDGKAIHYTESEERTQAMLQMKNAEISDGIVYKLLKEPINELMPDNLKGMLEVRVDLQNKILTLKFLDYDNELGYRYINAREYKYSSKKMDQKRLTDSREIVNNMSLYYEANDLNYVNNLINYGGITELFQEKANVALYQFPQIKNEIEKYPEFDYELHIFGGLGENEKIFSTGILFIKKDDIIYSAKTLSLVIKSVIFVDKNAEGSLVERATDRIKKYTNNNVDFTLTATTTPYGQFSTEIDGVLYPIQQSTIHFKDIDIDYDYLHIVEVPSEMIKNLEIHAFDKKTEIEINTTSYDVPVDAMISAEDMKNADNIKSLLAKYDYDLVDAYNIDIIGRKGNSKVKTIKNGVTVFIPIKGYKEGDVITIKHIKDDGTIGEELKGTVVSKNGKLYAKFITTHFSTYAIVKSNVDNPPTGDSVVNYMVLLTISLSISIPSLLLYKKSRN